MLSNIPSCKIDTPLPSRCKALDCSQSAVLKTLPTVRTPTLVAHPNDYGPSTRPERAFQAILHHDLSHPSSKQLRGGQHPGQCTVYVDAYVE